MLELSDDETRLLDAASDTAPDYPYGERGRSQRDRRISAAWRPASRGVTASRRN